MPLGVIANEVTQSSRMKKPLNLLDRHDLRSRDDGRSWIAALRSQ